MAQQQNVSFRAWIVFCIFFFHTVLCQQDGPPLIWEEDLIPALVTQGLREDTPRETIVGSLRARDPEGMKVTYGIESEILSVNEDTGQVRLTAFLDREIRDQYPVTVTAQDDIGNKIARSYTARIVDVNDQVPTFRGIPSGGYSASVREDALVGITVLGNINVTDNDIGPNAEIRLACFLPEQNVAAQKSCDDFDVSTREVSEGVYLGTITVKTPLNYETKSSYIMNIVALDNGSPQRSSTISVRINVQDVEASRLRFTNTRYTFNIFEGIAKDTEIGTLSVVDAEGGNRPIRVKIAEGEDGLGWFRVGRPRPDPSRAQHYIVSVYSNGNIDRESWDGLYEFDVEAIELDNGRETQSRARTTVEVTISDRNDNAPSFNSQSYDITIPEGLRRGSRIPGLNMVVKDGDAASNSEFALTIEGDRFGSFALSESNCNGECAVPVIVENARNFDYENENYRQQTFRVIARETTTAERLASTATVTVQLQDLNDNYPEFPQTRYNITIREDRSPGSLIATIVATDRDSGNLGKLVYRIVGEGGDTFSVNKVTGEISLAKRVDYERQSSYTLLYEAADLDGKQSQIPIYVSILNSNDQGPVFVNDNYNVVYDEGSSSFFLNITAVDRDQSSIVTYRIVGGNSQNLFVIDRYTGVVSLRRPISFADTGNTGFIQLVIQASDGGNPPQTANIPVSINVRDVNNRPSFGQMLYTATIPETAAAGQSVISVTANDLDTGAGGDLRYQITSGSAGRFTIDRRSGLIRVAQNANFDLQSGPSDYRMNVQAIDSGNPPMVGETQVLVRITDANNKLPEFIQNVYIASIRESSNPGTSVLQLVASDPDTNRRLEYSIRQSTVSAKDSDGRNLSPSASLRYRNAFGVDTVSGVIRIRQQLKREEVGEVSFIAQVADTNADSPRIQTATATVIVTIESTARQNQLVFPSAIPGEDPTFRVTIPEEEEVGYIVYNLVAIDPNNNKEVTNYQKVFGTDPMNYFFVDRITGRVTLNRRLDFERLPNKELTFQVRATSSGVSPVTALARMVVTVEDINDNSPIFSQQSYRFTVPEGQQFPAQMRVFATDADAASFGEIRYSLSGKGRELFYIDPVRGTIVVASNATLDRERIEGGVVSLLVKATDTPRGRTSDQRQTDVPLTIVVEDVNDNAPRFEQAQYNFYTRDTSRAGSALGDVKATDADVMSNGEITYIIRSGNIEDLFDIDRTSGTLRNIKDLLGHAQDIPYKLEVVASDNGAPPLMAAVIVNVFISDLQGNDDVPRILAPAVDGQSFSLPENATFDTIVTTINAVARGSSTPGTVYYTFLNNPLLTDQDYFSIDPFTGVIKLKKPVDREKQQVYQLIVVVENKLASTQNRRSLFVNVTDINDNVPSFLGCPGPRPERIKKVNVAEEGPALVEVTRVKACDIDMAPFNATYYYIIQGNEPLPGFTMSPFTIDKTSGVISTQMPLDREVIEKFMLYIKVSEDPNLDISNIVINDTDSTIQGVEIRVIDVDDNGPSFGDVNSFSTGVLATSQYHTRLMFIRARDQDSSDADAIYSLENVVFHGEDGKTRSTEGAFAIGKTDGIVYTNLRDYLDFQNGYFVMDVVAMDSKNRMSKATINIYVLRSTQRLKFHFNMPPEDVMKLQTDFIREVNSSIGSKYRINADSLHYALMPEGDRSRTRTDMCFHLVSENRVVDPNIALELFDNWEDNELREVFDEYKVRDIGLCSIRTVTYWWSDHWWLWWILIALTLLMILISLIAICCLCWCWEKYKRKRATPHKPYWLDTDGFQDANREYEWQEKTVKM